MLSVNNYIWDLADIIRSYMKVEKFQKKEFELLINSYNSIRKLTEEENKELKNYCTMMILDT
jgi:Ser/Thr protein kinase RdoA (MazF antagonist)